MLEPQRKDTETEMDAEDEVDALPEVEWKDVGFEDEKRIAMWRVQQCI